jgi:hypothetical protein
MHQGSTKQSLAPTRDGGWGSCHCIAAQHGIARPVKVLWGALGREKAQLLARSYLATNKKKDVSKKSDLP